MALPCSTAGAKSSWSSTTWQRGAADRFFTNLEGMVIKSFKHKGDNTNEMETAEVRQVDLDKEKLRPAA